MTTVRKNTRQANVRRTKSMPEWWMRRRISVLSRKHSAVAAAEVAAMDATVGDGLEAEDDSQSPTRVVVETRYGTITSIQLPAAAVAEIRASLESGLAAMQHLTVETVDGAVLLPGEVLRESIVRFRQAGLS
ncbi:MAG: hypothetical protein ACT4QA_14085 [Panacagrimonas sp.]